VITTVHGFYGGPSTSELGSVRRRFLGSEYEAAYYSNRHADRKEGRGRSGGDGGGARRIRARQPGD